MTLVNTIGINKLERSRKKGKQLSQHISTKARFVTDSSPEELIQSEKDKRQWMPHSVGLLVLAPRVDGLVLVQPRKVIERGASHVVVPPQRSLDTQVGVWGTAANITKELLLVPIHQDRIRYVGSGRGNAYRSGVLQPYGKWIHWFVIYIRGSTRVLNRESVWFVNPQWCGYKQLHEMNNYAMTTRKHMLLLQALASIDNSGQLIESTKARLSELLPALTKVA